jgi:flagellar assembly protein FliH
LSKIYKEAEGCELKKVLFLDIDHVGDLEEGVSVAEEEPEEFSGEEDQDGEELRSAEPPSPDLEKIKEEVFTRGKRAGLEIAEKQLGETVRALGDALEEIGRLRETILKNSAEDMLRLVMVIAEQVVQSEVAAKEDIILTTLNKALHGAIKSDEFHVKVNPEDFAVVTEKKPLFLAGISGLKNIAFEADPQIARGGCLVESSLGQVDATIETQMEEIRRHLMSSME